MATGFSTTENRIGQLTHSLRQLETAGLPKPSSCLLSDYLHFLVDHQLLTRETADNVESLCYGSRYGSLYLDEAVLRTTTGEVDAAVDKFRDLPSEVRQDLTAQLQQQHGIANVAPAPPPRPATTNPLQSPTATNAVPRPEPQFGLPQPPSEPTRAPLGPQFWVRIVAAALLWSLCVAGAAYYAHDEIALAFEGPEPPVIPQAERPRVVHNGRQSRMNGRRAQVLAADGEQAWADRMRSLGRTHMHRHEYAEFFFVYSSLISRNPENADDKNTLAWFLLRSPNPWYQDPVLAKKLAEEAVALDPKPRHLDTLAEAHYQNGDPTRAVEFEQQALAGEPPPVGDELEFFRNQLQKFRQAAARQRNDASLGVAPPSAN